MVNRPSLPYSASPPPQPPRVIGVQLWDWFTPRPTRRALKTRGRSGLIFFSFIFFNNRTIGAFIRIGREIQCLPYAGFFCVRSATPKVEKSTIMYFKTTQSLHLILVQLVSLCVLMFVENDYSYVKKKFM